MVHYQIKETPITIAEGWKSDNFSERANKKRTKTKAKKNKSDIIWYAEHVIKLTLIFDWGDLSVCAENTLFLVDRWFRLLQCLYSLET